MFSIKDFYYRQETLDKFRRHPDFDHLTQVGMDFGIANGLELENPYSVATMAPYLYPTGVLENMEVVAQVMQLLFHIDDKLGDEGTNTTPQKIAQREKLLNQLQFLIDNDKMPEDPEKEVGLVAMLMAKIRAGSPEHWFNRFKDSIVPYIRANIGMTKEKIQSLTLDEYRDIAMENSGMVFTVLLGEYATQNFLPAELITDNKAIGRKWDAQARQYDRYIETNQADESDTLKDTGDEGRLRIQIRTRQITSSQLIEDLRDIILPLLLRNVSIIGTFLNSFFSFPKEVLTGQTELNLIAVLSRPNSATYFNSIVEAFKIMNSELKKAEQRIETLREACALLGSDHPYTQTLLAYDVMLENMVTAAREWQVFTSRYNHPQHFLEEKVIYPEEQMLAES